MSDQAEFLELYLANEKGIRAFLHCLVRDPRDFDDVHQTVVLRLLERFEHYDRQRPFGPWARGVLAKEVLAMRRAHGRCPTPFSPELLQQIQDSFEQRLVHDATSEKQEALEKCLQTLPEKSQRMLALRYRESLSVTSVAKRIGNTAGATQRALSRIRDRLRECIEVRLASISRGSP